MAGELKEHKNWEGILFFLPCAVIVLRRRRDRKSSSPLDISCIHGPEAGGPAPLQEIFPCSDNEIYLNPRARSIFGIPSTSTFETQNEAVAWLASRIHPEDISLLPWLSSLDNVDSLQLPDDEAKVYRVMNSEDHQSGLQWIWVSGTTVLLPNMDDGDSVLVHTVVIVDSPNVSSSDDTAVFEAAPPQTSSQPSSSRQEVPPSQLFSIDTASTICHEIRNPLAGISGNLELLRMSLEKRVVILCEVLALLNESSELYHTSFTNPSLFSNLFIQTLEPSYLLEMCREDKEFSNAILQCVEHARALADRSLQETFGEQLTSITDGGLDNDAIDLREIVNHVAVMLKARAQFDGVSLRTSLPVTEVMVSRRRAHSIKQVIMNLVINAVRHSSLSGRVTIGVETVFSESARQKEGTLRTVGGESPRISPSRTSSQFLSWCKEKAKAGYGSHVSLEPKDNVLLGVKVFVDDTGIGMTREERSKLFRRFSQPTASVAPATTIPESDSSADALQTFEDDQNEHLHANPKNSGFGLGLAISQKLVNLMGSEIKVESEKGHGSRFFFVLKPESQKRIN
ncbi:hypothetical protein HDU67_004858 [Dinochytrium kinnereticum]|nr:hypothetical protein HDU67_004858 [Dinochytrium kinnereticum]